jgi:prevent-host-death family protein
MIRCRFDVRASFERARRLPRTMACCAARRLTVSPPLVRSHGQMKSIAVTEFKAQCLALLEEVARTGQPLVVTKRGKALARVVPSGGGKGIYPQDSLAETVTILGDVMSPVLPPSEWNAVRGDLLPSKRSVARRRG